MRWPKSLVPSKFRPSRRAAARLASVLALGRAVEALETRQLLAADTPFTVDGLPAVVAARGPSVIEAENYDFGGEGVAYHASYSTNPGGAYRPNEGVGVEGPAASTGGTYNVGYFNTGNWLNYTVNVAQAGTYVVDLRSATATSGATARVTFGSGGASTAAPVATTGSMAVPGTGGWGNYTDINATVNLAAGRQIMTLWDVSGGFNTDFIKLTPLADTGSREQPYNPSGTAPGAVNRGVPVVLPAFGAAQIESEDYDLGGQASGTTGVQTAGYNWTTPVQSQGTYPYTNTPFRPGEGVDLGNRATGLTTTNWRGGDWLQYSVLSATDTTPLDPTATTPSPQAIQPTTQYQLLVSYANAGTTTSSFTISSTTINPATGAATITPLGTLTLAPTGGIYNYSTALATITLPSAGLNTLRFTDNDAGGAASNVDIDNFRLINSRTTGNNGAPWDLPASGTTTRIAAANYDAAPGSAVTPTGTAPTVGPTADPTGGGTDVRNLSSGAALSYTVLADLSSRYQLALRVRNTGSTPATIQVTFDAGASLGTLGPNNSKPAPVVFIFTVPVGSGYQTITTATNTSANPSTTNPWVEIPAGPQTMQVKVTAGQVDYHYADLAALTATAAVKADPSQLGTYAAAPPNTVLNTIPDVFGIAYNTQYKWINAPANATVPTNDWWTNMLVSPFAGDMYAFPQKINDSQNGVVISGYSGVGTDSTGGSIQMTGQESLGVGAVGTTFSRDALLDFGDWTVHYRMQTAGAGSIDVTAGRGLPYTWFEFNGGLTPTLVAHGAGDASSAAYTATDANGNALGSTFTTDHFELNTGGQALAVFAPTGTTFTLVGGVYTVKFASGAKPYLVTAVLPDSSTTTLDTYYRSAYAIPRQVGATASSTYTWDPYNAATGQIVTHWALNTVSIDPNAPKGTLAAQGNLGTIQGWLPIQTSDGATGLTLLKGSSGQVLRYSSLNGDINVASGTNFTVSQATTGVNFELALPQTINAPTYTIDPSKPATTTVGTDYNPQAMRQFLQLYIQQHTDTAATAAAGKTILTYGNDTYWGAKPLQEYAEYALLAKQVGDTASYGILLDNLRTFLTDWFTYDPTKDTTSHFFAYYPGTHALIGFSPAYGSEDFTDNHFHYGYFTAAAGVLALLDPNWAAQYGGMAKMVAMQYANWLHSGQTDGGLNSDATSLPFLRTFEPWIGHSYAGGTGSYGGNNQESTSEAIQSWLGIVLLGQALNDPAMTSAGMMGYTVESKAVREQWFRVTPTASGTNNTGLPSTFSGPAGAYSNVGINFDGGKGYGTYFGTNPEYILGIQALPIWPSLDFLGRDSTAAAAATKAMLAQRQWYYNQAGNNPNYNPASPGTYNTFASFDAPGGFGGSDWLNIALGYQATYDPQSTANEYARILAQNTATAQQGTTGLYYFIDHSYQSYGDRDYGYHLSVPLGGVYTHAADSTTMSNTRTYMAYNAGTTAITVQVLNSSNVVVDSFTAQPGLNTITRSLTTGKHAPPLITTGPSGSPSPVTGTTATLSVLAHDDAGSDTGLTYSWSLVAGPSNAQPTYSSNGTNASKTTTVTFNTAGSYVFRVAVTDSHGLTTTSTVGLSVVATATKLAVTPTTATVFTGGTLQLAVSAVDQFGAAINQPAVAWTVGSGTGSVSTTGLYQAPNAAGSAVVTATSGALTASATLTVATRLPAPTGLTATVAANYAAVDLAWTAPSGTITGYNIYRGTTPGGESATPLNTSPVTGTTYHDATVQLGMTYYYTVLAVNAGGASPASNEADATTAPDLALKAPVKVSSTENNGTPGSAAVDGNSTTRWSSQFSDPQWIDVSLNGRYNITEVRLNWENAAGRDYQIQVSDDETNWTTIATITGNTTGGWHDYVGLKGAGSFVRIYGTARTTQYGYSLFDLNVYGTKVVTTTGAPTGLNATVASPYEVDLAWTAPSGTINGYNIYRGTTPGGESATPLNSSLITGTTYRDTTAQPGVTYYYTVAAVNAAGMSGPSNEATATTPTVASADLARNRPTTASSLESGAFPASNAVDGDNGTRWSSQFSDNQWIEVDLGATYNINDVRLNWEAAAGRDYQIQDSTDNVTWTTLAAVTGNTTAGWHDYAGLAGIGRYVRVLGTARLTPYGYSLYDFNVFGSGTTAGVTPLDRSNWVASASGTEGGGSASNAIDASTVSRWSGGLAQAAGQWFQLDLGSAQTFSRLTFDSGTSANDYARGFQVDFSDNGTDWATQPPAATGAGTGPLTSVDFGQAVKHRFLRIVLTAPSDYWWSISDLNLYV